MEPKPGHDITALLSRAKAGDKKASDELLPLVYDELRKLARLRMSQERPGQTLQATGLVHEAYLRIVGNDEPQAWDGRGHFFAAAAEAMRRILIDNARRKSRQRHGGELRRATFDTKDLGIRDTDTDLLDLDRALSELEQKDEQMANIVKLRFFAGLNVDETAAALNLSARTVSRGWVAARAWLQTRLPDGDETEKS